MKATDCARATEPQSRIRTKATHAATARIIIGGLLRRPNSHRIVRPSTARRPRRASRQSWCTPENRAQSPSVPVSKTQERDTSGLHLPAARDFPKKFETREVPTTMLRVLAAALAAAFVFAAGSAQAEMKREWVEYGHGDTKLKAYMAYDDQVSGRRPAVLMIHAREGMTPKTQQLAETWAKLGYVSFVADIFGYGQGVLPKDVPEMQAQTAIYTKDRALMRARTQAGFD